MLVSGCSHSFGYKLDDINKSWGNIFARNNNHELTNVSHPGCSLHYSIQQILNEIPKESYDTIVLQLTDISRITIPYNGDEVFFSDHINKAKEDKVFHLHKAAYLESVDGCNSLIKTEIVRFFYEKVMYSKFYLNTIINELYLLQQLLKLKNIDFILIPYDDWTWGYENPMNIWKFENSKIIDKTRYIDYPFMKWLRDNYNPDDFYIDNGFHLNEKGHKLFAEEYIPIFIKIDGK